MTSIHKHFILYKPAGYLSQFVHQHRQRRNKKMLGELYDFPEGTMSIGRLDEDTEGLLLLTTDGKVSYQIRSTEVEKEYYAQVDGVVDQHTVDRLSKGVEISLKGKIYQTLPCQTSIIDAPSGLSEGHRIRDERHGPTSWISITIREGKNRQVRKMTAVVGFPTLRLVRVRIGDIELGELKAGEMMEVEKLI